MQILIVGGGRLGFYTAKALKERAHGVTLLEKQFERIQPLSTELGIPVIFSDGTVVEALAEAGASDADVLLALTDRDQDNIVACQLAKQRFHVPKTIARVNNPKNSEIVKSLGADIAVCDTAILTGLIEQEVIVGEARLLATLNQGEAGIRELIIPDGWSRSGEPLESLALPRDCLIAAAVHAGQLSIPRGDTRLYAGDTIAAVVSRESAGAFLAVFQQTGAK